MFGLVSTVSESVLDPSNQASKVNCLQRFSILNLLVCRPRIITNNLSIVIFPVDLYPHLILNVFTDLIVKPSRAEISAGIHVYIT